MSPVVVQPITVCRLCFGAVRYVPLRSARTIAAGPGSASRNRTSGDDDSGRDRRIQSA